MKNSNIIIVLSYIVAGLGAGYTLTQKSKGSKGKEDVGKLAVGTIAGGLLGVMGANISLMARKTVFDS